MSRVAILSYHKIGEPPEGGWESWYYVPVATFEAHLGLLLERGWQPIDPGTLLAGLDRPETLADRSVLVTFDDGYRSLADQARPVLDRAGFPWVVFVPTAFIGRSNLFDEGEEPMEPIASWHDLQTWARQGVSIQSHGVGHRPMSELAPDEQDVELCRSRHDLELELDAPVELFAFPYGDEGNEPSVMSDRVRRAGYSAAFLYGGGPVEVTSADRYRLPRIAMGPDTDLEQLVG